MPASMLYHTNQITDIQVKNVEYVESKIIFHAIYQPKNASCSCCAYQIYWCHFKVKIYEAANCI